MRFKDVSAEFEGSKSVVDNSVNLLFVPIIPNNTASLSCTFIVVHSLMLVFFYLNSNI